MKIHAIAPGFGLTTDKAACGATPGRGLAGRQATLSTRIEEITCRDCLIAKRERYRANFAATDRAIADRLDDLESGYRTHAKR
ncbi:hypothetical protein CMI37_38340 [Candidatus Pacearchaeota archaeon]|nr:hypothetical protein [Candidatus Pacearchaeota archaeon]|tara:strand:- start:815 stop:1063 length:249 start_codon:yes stop_codon:yes gene_type:complete